MRGEEGQQPPPGGGPLAGATIGLSKAQAVKGFERGEIIAKRFRVIEPIGTGGMGTVYLVEDSLLPRAPRFALKLLAPDIDSVELAREAAIAQEMRHANLVRVHRDGNHDGRAFLVMEYCDGGDLEVLLASRGGHLPLDEATRLTIEVLQGLSELHDHKVLHLDIKPGNVLLLKSGDAKLSDFGISKTLQSSQDTTARKMTGTPGYMAPEQFEGGKQDTRTDIYAIGMLFFRMVAGRFPFESEDVQSAQRWHTSRTRSLTGLPTEVAPFVSGCVAFDLNDRFATCSEALAALEKSGGSRGIRWFALHPAHLQQLRTAKRDSFATIAAVGFRGAKVGVDNAILDSLMAEGLVRVSGWSAKGLRLETHLSALIANDRIDLAKKALDNAEQGTSPIAKALSNRESTYQAKKALAGVSDVPGKVVVAIIQAVLLDDHRGAQKTLEAIGCEQSVPVDRVSQDTTTLLEAARAWSCIECADRDQQIAFMLDAATDCAESWQEHLAVAEAVAVLLEDDDSIRRALQAAEKAGDSADFELERRLAWAWRTLLNDERRAKGLAQQVIRAARRHDTKEETLVKASELLGGLFEDSQAVEELLDSHSTDDGSAKHLEMVGRVWGALGDPGKAKACRQRANKKRQQDRAEQKRLEKQRKAEEQERREEARRKAEAERKAAEARRRELEKQERERQAKRKAAEAEQRAAEAKRRKEDARRKKEEEERRINAERMKREWAEREEKEKEEKERKRKAEEQRRREERAAEAKLLREEEERLRKEAERSDFRKKLLIALVVTGFFAFLCLGTFTTFFAEKPATVVQPAPIEPTPATMLPEEPEPEPEPATPNRPTPKKPSSTTTPTTPKPAAPPPATVTQPEPTPEPVVAAVDESEIKEEVPVSAFPDVSGKWKGTHEGAYFSIKFSQSEGGRLTGSGQAEHKGLQMTLSFQGQVNDSGTISGSYTFPDDPSAGTMSFQGTVSGGSLSGGGFSLKRK